MFGFIHDAEILFSSKDDPYDTIPELIIYIILDFYYERAHVNVSFQQRNGRCKITQIFGLPSDRVNFKKLVKQMKKQFQSNGTIKNDEEKGMVIQMAGDKREEIAEYIVKLNIGVGKDQITIQGY